MRTASPGRRRRRQRRRRRRLRLHPPQLHRRRPHRPARPGQHRVRRHHRRRRGGQHLRTRTAARRQTGTLERLQPRIRRSRPVRPQPQPCKDRPGTGRQRQHRRRHGNAHRPGLQLPRRRRAPARRQRQDPGPDPLHPPDRTSRNSADTELIVASDVHNPLRGPTGAPAVFGPQKGAGPRRSRPSTTAWRTSWPSWPRPDSPTPRPLAAHEGAGSAGGIGYACLLLGAKQVSGADYFLDLLDFNTRKDSCDVVITGEGSIDEQTLAGKLPAAVARRSGGRPIIAVAGRSLLPQERWSEMALNRVYTLADYTDLDSSKDPELSAALLHRIGQDIAAGLR